MHTLQGMVFKEDYEFGTFQKNVLSNLSRYQKVIKKCSY